MESTMRSTRHLLRRGGEGREGRVGRRMREGRARRRARCLVRRVVVGGGMKGMGRR